MLSTVPSRDVLTWVDIKRYYFKVVSFNRFQTESNIPSFDLARACDVAGCIKHTESRIACEGTDTILNTLKLLSLKRWFLAFFLRWKYPARLWYSKWVFEHKIVFLVLTLLPLDVLRIGASRYPIHPVKFKDLHISVNQLLASAQNEFRSSRNDPMLVHIWTTYWMQSTILDNFYSSVHELTTFGTDS